MKEEKKVYDALIIGAGITGLSTAIPLYEAGCSFLILEKTERVGGQIRTLHEKGYTYETGPNTGALSFLEVEEVFRFASARGAKLEIAKPQSKGRWIYKGDRFHALPTGLMSAIGTPLFRFSDKLRILLEPWRKKGTDPMESVGQLAERRLGKSFVSYAVDPFISGIYAGDPYKLVTRYALPKLYQLEQNYGSFVRGAMRLARERKKSAEPQPTKEVFSALGGLEQLPLALAEKLSEKGEISLGVSQLKIGREGGYWQVSYLDGRGVARQVTARELILTPQAGEQARLLHDLDPSLDLSALDSLRYNPVIEVVVGFDDLGELQFPAFGGLVPSREQRSLLGILFPSSCFEGRTPKEASRLFNIFMGGERLGEQQLSLSDEELKSLALRELRQMLSLPEGKEPDLVRVFRHPRAIPQYDRLMEPLLETLEQLEERYPGLHLLGGMRDGVGLAHRMKQGLQRGRLIARRIKA